TTLFRSVHPGPVVALGIPVVFHRHGVGALHLVRQGLDLLETDIGVGDRRVGEAGDADFRLLPILRDVFHHTEIQGIAHAGGYTGGLQAHFQAVDAHIALRYLSHDGVELGRVVGAYPGAVAAAEAGVRVLEHGAVLGVLGVGGGGAALEAHRVVAVVAGHGDVEALVIRVGAPLHITHGAERQVRRGLVLLGAGGFAGVAADAVVGGEEKCVLLVAVGVAADFLVAVDLHGTAPGEFFLHQLDQIDLLAVAVGVGNLRIRQQCVGPLAGADFPQGAAVP